MLPENEMSGRTEPRSEDVWEVAAGTGSLAPPQPISNKTAAAPVRIERNLMAVLLYPNERNEAPVICLGEMSRDMILSSYEDG